MTMEAHASGRSSLAKANGAPRCGAKTRTTGQPCKHLARKGSGRCRVSLFSPLMRQGPLRTWVRSSDHRGDGWFSQEAIATRKEQRAVLRALKAAAKKLERRRS
jgi:hypothetical protein